MKLEKIVIATKHVTIHILQILYHFIFTLAESIIDSMHTCLDTVQSDGGDTDNTMHEHPQDADTDNTMDDHDHNISDDEVEFLEEMLPLDPRKDDESVTPTPPTL